jgi:hypothetical protein
LAKWVTRAVWILPPPPLHGEEGFRSLNKSILIVNPLLIISGQILNVIVGFLLGKRLRIYAEKLAYPGGEIYRPATRACMETSPILLFTSRGFFYTHAETLSIVCSVDSVYLSRLLFQDISHPDNFTVAAS